MLPFFISSITPRACLCPRKYNKFKSGPIFGMLGVDTCDNNTPGITKVPRFGFGPWFTFLVYNLAPKPKKKTAILIHSDPHWVLDIQNHEAAGTELWKPALVVGPFCSSRHAENFKSLWEKGPRPRYDRLLWGVVLCRTYNDKHKIDLWYESNGDLVLAIEVPARLAEERVKRQHIRRMRRGAPGERRQRMFELMSKEDRDVTVGSTKARREGREARDGKKKK